MHKAGYQQHGFTIVELLVVIVVIGILAAITVVSYTGISQKAIVAMLQSDLSTSAQRLKMYQVEHGAFPATIDTASNCPTGPADVNYCLKPSSGNTFTYSSSSPYSTFSLVATNTNGTSYRITDNTGPVLVTATPITAIAAIVGTPQVGQVLTAGTLTPSGATASYQWQSSATSGGTYTAISGATSSSYAPVSGDVGRYIEVVATGTNTYGGSVTSASVGPVVTLIFATGGTITSSSGTRTHTFGPGTYNLTATASGTITVVINGGGGGGGGGGYVDDGCGHWGVAGTGGTGGQSSVTAGGTGYIAYGGAGGTGGDDCFGHGNNGSTGSTNLPSGWTSTNGGGGVVGVGGEGDLSPENDGGNGGAGGRLVGSLSVSNGQSVTVVAGPAGSGGSGSNGSQSGSNGGSGGVIISYPY